MNTENMLLWAILLLISAGIFAGCLWGVQAVRAVAGWLGRRLGDLFFGRVPGGRK